MNKHLENHKNLREIKTARTEKKINKFARKGYIPLVKRVYHNSNFISKYAIYQHKETKEIKVLADLRSRYRDDLSNYEAVIPFTYYKPIHTKSPFAAYILPKDLKIGEHVFLLDLIENIVGWESNQGDIGKLESCEAVWNGEDFEILFDEDTDVEYFIG